MDNEHTLNLQTASLRNSPRLLTLTGFLLTLMTLLVTQRETGVSLFVLWSESFEYGHGVLVVPISIYLLWLRREQILSCPINANSVGMALTAVLVVVLSLSSLLGILIGEQIILVLLLISTIHAILGQQMARLCAIPILFLFLAIPFWSYLIPFLQAVAATMSTHIVRGIGVPVFNEGLYLTIPDGRFLVAEVCSGLRYLLASLTLGSLFAVMNLDTIKFRLLLFLTGIGLGIVFNWIRVALIVSSGHFFGMDSFLVDKHVWLGWVLFVVVSVLLILVGNYFQNKEEQIESRPDSDRAGDSAKASPMLLSGLYSLLCICLLSGSAWLTTSNARASIQPTDFNLEHIKISNYSSFISENDDGWTADYQTPDAVDHKIFRTNSSPINLYVAYYHTQRQGAEVVNDSNDLFDTDAWTRAELRPKPDQVKVTDELVVEEFVIKRRGTRTQRLVWRYYWVSGRYAATGIDAKLKQIRGLLEGKNSAAGIVISTPIVGSNEQSRIELKSFLKNSLEPISNYLSSFN